MNSQKINMNENKKIVDYKKIKKLWKHLQKLLIYFLRSKPNTKILKDICFEDAVKKRVVKV